MKKPVFALLLATSLFALASCGGPAEDSKGSVPPSASSQTSTSSTPKSSASQAPVKKVNISGISLFDRSEKAYIRVTGTQSNYAAGEFKWAWGIKEQNGGFVDGKANPTADDFKVVEFDGNDQFTVEYCLTDIAALASGTLYRIYGGTPETYDDIPFPSNQFGATDATRHYYLRQDQDNSLVFDSIQPISFTKASIVKLTKEELPTGVTNAGAYVKFGGENTAHLTVEMIDGWNAAGKIAGNFQRVIGDYSVREHSDEERFWKIEGDDVFFYCYVGFIEEGEGWMTHFDLVSGNSNAGLQFATVIKGEDPYLINGASYRVYADRTAQGEENFWGCLGIYRDVDPNPND